MFLLFICCESCHPRDVCISLLKKVKLIRHVSVASRSKNEDKNLQINAIHSALNSMAGEGPPYLVLIKVVGLLGSLQLAGKLESPLVTGSVSLLTQSVEKEM